MTKRKLRRNLDSPPLEFSRSLGDQFVSRVLYGSLLRRGAKPDSDIDVPVIVRNGADWFSAVGTPKARSPIATFDPQPPGLTTDRSKAIDWCRGTSSTG